MNVLDLENLLKQVLKASGKKSSLAFILDLTLINAVLILLSHFVICSWMNRAWPLDLIFKSKSLYSEGLSRASLAIGEDTSIVALKALIDDGLTHSLEDFFLTYFFIAHKVKGKGFLWSLLIPRWNQQLLLIFYLCNASLSIDRFREALVKAISLIHHRHISLVRNCYSL